jgi:uncharacterized protein (UPF0276 family)
VAIISETRADLTMRTGIGLRLPHIAEVVATRPSLGWLEVHPENILANPHATELLIDLASTYPLSLHTVGISIGSAEGIDHAHLRRLRHLVDLVDPILVSGHLAWSTHGGAYLNDLLPLPYSGDTLALVTRHLEQVQDALGRPFLIENPSSYVAFTHSTMTELEFLQALVTRSGCRLLCDVSNIFVSGHNMGYDPYAFLEGIPPHAVAELHLGGFTPEDDEATPGGTLLIDTHAHGIAEPVWDLYARAVERFPAAPTLIEWDNDLPTLATLAGEAKRADAVRERRSEVCRAGAC